MIKLSRVVAIILALLAFCIFIFMIIGFIILPLFGQMNEFLQKLPALAAKSNIQDLDSMLKDPSTIPLLPSDFNMLVNGLLNWAMGFVGTVLRNLVQSSLGIVQSLIGLIIVPFLAFYFLKDWRELRLMVINLFNYDAQDKAAEVVDEIGRTMSAYVRGMGKLSLISGFVITIGTAFLGIDFPLGHPCRNGTGSRTADGRCACCIYCLRSGAGGCLSCSAFLSGILSAGCQFYYA